MFPSFSFPMYESNTKQEINPHQILVTLLNMKTQQNRLQPFLGHQHQSTKFSFLPQTQMMQNSFQNSLNGVDQLPLFERINPHKAQLQPPQLDFQFLRSLRPIPFAYKPFPFELSSSIERSPISESDSEVQQEKSEQAPHVNIKVEEVQIKCEESENNSSHHLTCETEKVSASKKIKKCEKNVNTCGHPERKHYAKGMCNNCYHKYGRIGKPDLCEHDVLYAKGLCQKCYLVKYNHQKALSSKKKKKVKRSNKSKKSE
jgi:hypothetical protein